MKKPIQDEFTDLPISYERKRQLRMKRDHPEKYRAYIRYKSFSNQWDYVGKSSKYRSNQWDYVGRPHKKK